MGGGRVGRGGGTVRINAYYNKKSLLGKRGTAIKFAMEDKLFFKCSVITLY